MRALLPPTKTVAVATRCTAATRARNDWSEMGEGRPWRRGGGRGGARQRGRQRCGRGGRADWWRKGRATGGVGVGIPDGRLSRLGFFPFFSFFNMTSVDEDKCVEESSLAVLPRLQCSPSSFSGHQVILFYDFFSTVEVHILCDRRAVVSLAFWY